MGAFNSYTLTTTASTSDTQLIWQGGQLKQLALPYSWDGTTLTLPDVGVKIGGMAIGPVANIDRIDNLGASGFDIRTISESNVITGITTEQIALGSGAKIIQGVDGFIEIRDAAQTKGAFIGVDSSGVLALRNGTNAQEFRTYKTCTDDSNKAYGSIGWSGNYFNLSTASFGSETGMPKAMRLHGDNGVQFGTGGSNRFYIDANGHLQWNSDNTYDIGADGVNRPKDIFVAGRVVAAGDILANTLDIQAGIGSAPADTSSPTGWGIIKVAGSEYRFPLYAP